MNLQKTFTDIYHENFWESDESRSGQGSTFEATEAIREILPYLFIAYDIGSILDIPCGDYSWWSKMWKNALSDEVFYKGPTYIGADIVPELIKENHEKFPDVDFRVLDVVSDDLPQVDLVFCRDCLGHLSNTNVERALANMKASGAKYLMATTYYDPKWHVDADILDGGWRPINMIKQFGLGEPIILINENFTANMEYHDKSLGLWKL